MDFLDPKATRRHRIRLFIGYALMAMLIFTASAILVFQAYGFDLDRKTGEVIQNGLVFVDSAPDKANVFFNGQLQKDKTNNRFALPSGQYELKLQKEGYRNWQRDFLIDGGEVERFTYPLLVPNKLESRAIQTYKTAPTFVTESPDRRWAVVDQANSLTGFIEYDLNTLNDADDKPRVRPFTVPAGLFSGRVPGNHTIKLVEWANDNKHFLVKHTYDGGSEFVIVSRENPAASININRLLKQNPAKVTLRDKKFDQWYIFTQKGGILQAANAEAVITPVIKGVISYKTHDDDTILYTKLTPDGTKQRLTLKHGDDSYTIRDVANGKTMLEIARYDDRWYIVIGSDAESKTYVYVDPVHVLQQSDGPPLVPTTVLKAVGPMTGVSFSQNTRFIVTQSGQHFEVYDAEYDQNYKYDITKAFDSGTPVTWMDGHRLIGRHKNQAIIFDFNGDNKQELVASLPGAPLLFNRDYTILYTVSNAAAAGQFSLYDTHLRLEADR